jgi:chromosome segregation ATPase
MTEDLTKQLPQSANEKLTLILTTVQSLTVRVDSVDSRLDRFEETMNDVRPVWRLLVTDVALLRQGQLLLEAGQQRLEEQCRRMEGGLDSLRSEVQEFRQCVDHRFLILSGTVLEHFNKLEQRVTRLELNPNPPNTQT